MFNTYSYTAHVSFILHIYLQSLHFIQSFLESLLIIFSGYQLMQNQVVLGYLGTSKLTIIIQSIRSFVACKQAPGWVNGFSAS